MKSADRSDKKWLKVSSEAIIALLNDDAALAIELLSTIGEHEAADFIRINGCDLTKFLANSYSFRHVSSSH